MADRINSGTSWGDAKIVAPFSLALILAKTNTNKNSSIGTSMPSQARPITAMAVISRRHADSHSPDGPDPAIEPQAGKKTRILTLFNVERPKTSELAPRAEGGRLWLGNPARGLPDSQFCKVSSVDQLPGSPAGASPLSPHESSTGNQ